MPRLCSLSSSSSVLVFVRTLLGRLVSSVAWLSTSFSQFNAGLPEGPRQSPRVACCCGGFWGSWKPSWTAHLIRFSWCSPQCAMSVNCLKLMATFCCMLFFKANWKHVARLEQSVWWVDPAVLRVGLSFDLLDEVWQAISVPLLKIHSQRLCNLVPSAPQWGHGDGLHLRPAQQEEDAVEGQSMPVARCQNRLWNIIVTCRQLVEATKFARKSKNRKKKLIIVQGTNCRREAKTAPGDVTPTGPVATGSKSWRRCLPSKLLHGTSQQPCRWSLSPCHLRSTHGHHCRTASRDRHCRTASHVATASRGRHPASATGRHPATDWRASPTSSTWCTRPKGWEGAVSRAKILRYKGLTFVEGSVEVKLPTIWTGEKQSRAEAERRERVEERRSEKRKSQKKEDADARKGRKVAKHCVF